MLVMQCTCPVRCIFEGLFRAEQHVWRCRVVHAPWRGRHLPLAVYVCPGVDAPCDRVVVVVLWVMAVRWGTWEGCSLLATETINARERRQPLMADMFSFVNGHTWGANCPSRDGCSS